MGKSAEEKLKEGWRLVTNEKSPRGYDIALIWEATKGGITGFIYMTEGELQAIRQGSGLTF